MAQIISEKENEPKSLIRKKSNVNQSEKAKNIEKETDDVTNGDCSDKSPKAKKKAREYMPEFRSGAYALLVTLFEKEIDEENAAMTKAALTKEAQKHCDASFSSVIVKINKIKICLW